VQTTAKNTWGCRRGRYALLPDKGKISREEADRKAEEEYQLFNPTQRIDSDFDKELRGLFDAE
jgi:hypothetical protein